MVTGPSSPESSSGAVRVSLGLVSNLADVNRVIAFARQFVGT